MEHSIHVHFTDEEKVYRWDEEDDLQTETVEEKLKTGTDERSSVSHDEGTCRSLWQINQLKQSQIIDSLTCNIFFINYTGILEIKRDTHVM